MDFTERYPDSSSSVALAVRRGDVETLKRLVERGKSIETRDNRGYRPIHEAAHWGQDDCLKFLVESTVALTVSLKCVKKKFIRYNLQVPIRLVFKVMLTCR